LRSHFCIGKENTELYPGIGKSVCRSWWLKVDLHLNYWMVLNPLLEFYLATISEV